MAGPNDRKSQDSTGPGKKDDQLAFALAKGLTRVKAAAEAGVSEKTCYVRLRDPAFRALVKSYRTRMMDESLGTLTRSSAKAFKRLDSLLRNADVSVQLAAAKCLAVLLVRVATAHALDERPSTVEDRIEARPRLDVLGYDARYPEGDPRRCDYRSNGRREDEDGEDGS
jgi:hypothetical protein